MCDFVIESGVLTECSNCDNEIIIPAGVTRIGDGAFEGIGGIKKVVISEGVTEIGDSAFEECYELETVVLPDSLEKIGEYAFYLCTKLKNINMPKNVSEIGKLAFGDAFGLADENGFITINNDLFGYMGKERTVFIPENIKRIRDCAFSGNKNIARVIIPKGVGSIGNGAFWDCKNLKNVFIPTSVIHIGDKAFECFEFNEKNTLQKLFSISGAKFDEIVIHAQKGSFAESYAKENKLPFVVEKND
ncbi:MAG: leucine-rich repeat domain-containing protein [Oscillospiraceae bacterium]|nr:leucine-rich repeat domain-containing protein [Oscillospiraceae bacterium]